MSLMGNKFEITVMAITCLLVGLAGLFVIAESIERIIEGRWFVGLFCLIFIGLPTTSALGYILSLIKRLADWLVGR